MFLHVGRPKGLLSLNSLALKQEKPSRSSVKIAIIDDEPFPYVELLRQHDLAVKELGDIRDISAVAEYQVILCDIKGVGHAFGSKYEGGHVIEEISRLFPHKILIAYTAHQWDPTYNRFFEKCDFTVKKDLDTNEWLYYIDRATALSQDPAAQWKRVRSALVHLDVDLFDIALLEQQFVQKLRDKNRPFPTDSIQRRLTAQARRAVVNFAASAFVGVLAT